MHRQYTAYIEQDAIITIRWYLAHVSAVTGHPQANYEQQLRYSENITQWDPISFTLNLDKIWKFLLKIKTVE